MKLIINELLQFLIPYSIVKKIILSSIYEAKKQTKNKERCCAAKATQIV
jgi:hypothetical protein